MEGEFEIPWMQLFTFTIFAVIFYFVNKATCSDKCFIEFRSSIVIIFIVLFSMIFGNTCIWVSRYFMPHFTANGISGSILGEPVVLPKNKEGIEYCVFNLGSSLLPVPMRGKLATAVLPKSQLNKVGNSYVAKTFMPLYPFPKLPLEVYHYLKRNKEDYNIEKIYFGKFDAEFIHTNPDLLDKEKQIEDMQAQITLRTDIIERDNDVIIEQVELGKKLAGGNKSMWEKFLGSKKNDESES